jgi:hypothetical protein
LPYPSADVRRIAGQDHHHEELAVSFQLEIATDRMAVSPESVIASTTSHAGHLSGVLGAQACSGADDDPDARSHAHAVCVPSLELDGHVQIAGPSETLAALPPERLARSRPTGRTGRAGPAYRQPSKEQRGR